MKIQEHETINEAELNERPGFYDSLTDSPWLERMASNIDLSVKLLRVSEVIDGVPGSDSITFTFTKNYINPPVFRGIFINSDDTYGIITPPFEWYENGVFDKTVTIPITAPVKKARIRVYNLDI